MTIFTQTASPVLAVTLLEWRGLRFPVIVGGQLTFVLLLRSPRANRSWLRRLLSEINRTRFLFSCQVTMAELEIEGDVQGFQTDIVRLDLMHSIGSGIRLLGQELDPLSL